MAISTDKDAFEYIDESLKEDPEIMEIYEYDN